MAIKKSDLYSKLWASCDELRGGIRRPLRHPAQEYHTLPRSPKPCPSAYPTWITIGGHPYQVSVQRRVAGNGSMGAILYTTKRIEVVASSSGT